MSRLRAAAVVALWDPERAPAVLERLRRTYGAAHPLTVVAVVNSESTRSGGTVGADLVITGSNADAEFSAYDEGLRVLDEQSVAADVLILANDRAFSYDAVELERRAGRLFESVVRHELAVGHIDALPRPMEVLGRRVHGYLRSNLVVLPRASVPVGASVTAVPAARFDELVPLAYPGEQALAAIGSPAYVEFLRDWITGAGDSDSWYRAQPLDEASWPALRAKAKSIVNEHLLSVTLEEAGLELTSTRAAVSPLVRTRPGRALARALRADRTQRWQLRGARGLRGSRE